MDRNVAHTWPVCCYSIIVKTVPKGAVLLHRLLAANSNLAVELQVFSLPDPAAPTPLCWQPDGSSMLQFAHAAGCANPVAVGACWLHAWVLAV